MFSAFFGAIENGRLRSRGQLLERQRQIGADKPSPDPGRGKILADAAQKAGKPAPPEVQEMTGAFKTPTLRGVGLSGPYFHDGRAKTLEEAVDLLAVWISVDAYHQLVIDAGWSPERMISRIWGLCEASFVLPASAESAKGKPKRPHRPHP